MVDPTARDLISRMADQLDHYRQLLIDDRRETHPLATEARAYLAAEPQGEGPELSDDELLRVYGLAKRDNNYEGPIDDWPKRAERAATVAGLRAAIAADRARWGRPAAPPPPAEGEGPTDDELLGAVRHLYADQSAADMGAADDLRTARAVLARWGCSAAAHQRGGPAMSTPTPSDRMALALCPHRQLCTVPSRHCRRSCHEESAAVAREIAQILRERYGGSSVTADWLDGVGGGQP